LTSPSPVTAPGPTAVPASNPALIRKLCCLMLGLAIFVIGLDQWSKLWIRTNLSPGEERELWPGVVHLSHVLNHGAAWGAFEGQRWMLVIVSLGVAGAVIYYMRRIVERGLLATVAMGFILGGAVGNLIDRAFLGAVTDMIDCDTPWRIVREFPVFNLADSALTLGVFLLAVYLMFVPETPAAPRSKK
jgi:signal peptidase II